MNYLDKLKTAVRRIGGKGRFQLDWYLAECVSQDMAEQLMANAELLGPPVTVLTEEQPNECHANSMKYVGTKGGTLWSGFGLGEGVWRVHSWVVKSGEVIEATPFACERYVGIAVNSLERVFACYGHHPGFPLELVKEVRGKIAKLEAQAQLDAGTPAQSRADSGPRPRRAVPVDRHTNLADAHRELCRKHRRLLRLRARRNRDPRRQERAAKRAGIHDESL